MVINDKSQGNQREFSMKFGYCACKGLLSLQIGVQIVFTIIPLGILTAYYEN